MLKDNYIRYHAVELMKQLDYLDDNDKLEHLDELIAILSKRKESLRFHSKSKDHYEVKNIGGTYVIYKNGVRQKGSYLTEDDAYDTFEEDLT